MAKQQILDSVKDAPEHELVAAIVTMLDEDWISDPISLARIIQACTEALVEQLTSYS